VLENLSLRYKISLNLSLAVLFTAMVVGGVLIWRNYDDMRAEMRRNAAEIGKAMSGPLIDALKHDDPWPAYRVLRSARSEQPGRERQLILLDGDMRVFVSSHPRKYPMNTALRSVNSENVALAAAIAKRRGAVAAYSFTGEDQGDFSIVVPVIDQGVARGTLVFSHPDSVFQSALVRIVRRVLLSSLLAMAILLPIAWYIGNRTVSPLLDLAKRMEAVGHVPVDEIDKAPVANDDEIGRLTSRFNAMIDELDVKQSLERQVIVSERLAALGRLVAGVAHEVNNPLGGMLNAISTYRRYATPDERSERTISLLERGIEQIRETVAALLVEAKAEWHGLTPQDIEDVRTLVQADASRRRLDLQWDNGLHDTLSMPATPIRQMLINLSLNAVQAATEGGRVSLRVGAADGQLDILVENEGQPIPEEQMGRLFEPFTSSSPSGNGLGLWVTYQIVRQLDGEILVVCDKGVTSFEVRIPLKEAA
jgi:signal transduction histidine kinase